ncbi:MULTISPECIES: cytochrome c biogenesis protein ResB [unclassified Massilia]|uniref:cytochrome c biogenesis protein ResB n=1 Tax=unclassified Massilia TaxID=2609279 RepID=UPI001786EF22|nr:MULTISPECIES: cytochrome c biogenesis protein ResB [unclassified Massilia]MBD8533331.1 cytochrome c biogenesis protein ResB [Massilia sp. CFBP 13647]MBD8676710.1 cytochrome c biogenesis protein ResB [Massilia sp. CFBP 13721]
MSTTGIELNTRRSWLAETVELVSSMRFAISLLMILAIAAIIGTVLRQGDIMPNYVNQFGPFWYEVFRKLGLYTVYTSWWFLLILLVLIVSTSLCVIRNAPKMMRDMRSWRESVREESLRNFHHKSEWTAPLDAAALAQQSAVRLGHAGYKVKIVEKEHGTLVAAKKGAGNKFGYIFAHTAIIVILLGGMLDSELPIRIQQWVFGKTPYSGGGLIADVPAQHRLSVNNPTYRGNILLAEGQTGRVASIAQASGTLLQELPFDLELKKFHIEFYSTGMPKLFASDVVVHDRELGKTFPATIKVNEPLIYKGVAVYQSSFEDGGSRLTLTGFPMAGTDAKAFTIAGEVNGATELKAAGATYSVEWSGFRPFNVENIAANNDVRAVSKSQSLNEQLTATLGKASGSAGKHAGNKDLKNVGPSVQYKLRDQTGQAKEFLNYMQPVTLEGSQVYLAGVRTSPSEAFRFLRIPADDAYGVREWMRLRAALADPGLRAEAARRYAGRTMTAGQGEGAGFGDQLRESAERTLAMFAGEGTPGGFVAVAQFLEKIPAAEQEKAAAVFIKMLNGVLWELWQAARIKDGLAPIEGNDTHARFLQLATNALSDSFFYGAPVYLQLDEFHEVKASVLQVTRSPGKKIVYLGCVLLIAGIFAMFYIRERRLWIWVRKQDNGAHALMAMSTQRKTLDFENEFAELAARLPQSA